MAKIKTNMEKFKPKRATTPKTAERLGRALEKKAHKSVLDEGMDAPWGGPAIVTMKDQELKREKELLEAMLLKEERELALKDFWFFLTHVLFPAVWEENYTQSFHQPICNILQALGKGENFMFLLPREHRKSYIITIAWSIWLILRDPNIRIQFIGVKQSTCEKFCSLIRDAFLPENKEFAHFQSVFPDFVIAETTKKMEKMAWTHHKREVVLADPTVFSTYLANPSTGGRCDVQIWDDAFDRKNLSNPDMAAKTIEKMIDLFPILGLTSKYRNRVVVGTRWTYFDPYGMMMGEKLDEGDTPEGLEDISLPPFRAMIRHAKELPDKLCEHCPKHVVAEFPHGHPDWHDGKPIFEPIVDDDLLQQRYKEYLMDPNKGESLFFHQYMNVTMAPGDQKFRPEWFIDFDKPSWPVPKRKALVIDSADKDFQREGRGDWMVALMGDFDDYGRLCVRYGLRSNRWTREEFIRRIVTWCEATGWFPNLVAKEKFSNDTFLTDIRRTFLNINQPVYVLPISRPTHKGQIMKKYDWITETLQAPMERAEIIWGSQCPNDIRKRAEYELTSLGHVAHDDVADSLSIFFAPGIRLEQPTRHTRPMGDWMPPDLGLYVAGQNQPQQANPFAQADPTAMQRLAADGGSINISPEGVGGEWNTEGAVLNVAPHPGNLEIAFDPRGNKK